MLANNTEFGRSPNLTVEAFGALGYCMTLFPLTAFRAALKSARDTLADIKTLGHQRERLPQMAWDYYASGADDESCVRRNAEAFAKYLLHYRVLVDVARRDR